jgi:hypothetical protein
MTYQTQEEMMTNLARALFAVGVDACAIAATAQNPNPLTANAKVPVWRAERFRGQVGGEST